MFKTKEELIDELNKRVYTIYVSEIMNMIIAYKAQKNTIIDILNESFKMDIDFTGCSWRCLVKNKLGIKDIKKETLDNKFSETLNPIYNIINKYIVVEKKLRDLEGLYNQLDLNKNSENELSIRRHFKFDINSAGFIQITAPTFSGLTKEELVTITGFREFMEFDNTEQVMEWLNIYSRCFKQGYSSNFLVKGKIVYATVYKSEQMIEEEKINDDRF